MLPTGTGWPGPFPTLERPRWTDMEIKRAVAVALDHGQRVERQRIATAMAELDASERAAGARAYASARTSVRAAMAVSAAANGQPEWIGVGDRWQPWTPEKLERYQALLDSWKEDRGDRGRRDDQRGEVPAGAAHGGTAPAQGDQHQGSRPDAVGQG